MKWPLACFSTVALLASLVSPARAEVPISDEARVHFNAGVNFLQDPDGARHEEAYHEFKTAYAASPSWKILGNLGIVAMKLERDGEAIAAYSKYLSEGGKDVDPTEGAQISKDLDTLRAAVVEVTLSSNPPGASIVDERIPASGAPIRNRYGISSQSMTLGVRPGHHRITASLAGYQDMVWEVDLEPRQKVPYQFELQKVATGTGAAPTPVDAGPQAKPSNPLRPISYVAMGVGAVGVGLGAVFGLKAKGKYEDANDLCPAFPCNLTTEQAADRKTLGEDGDSAKTMSLVGFIAGGAVLATGVVLFVVSGNGSTPHTEKTAAAKVSPWFGLGQDGSKALGLEGTF